MVVIKLIGVSIMAMAIGALYRIPRQLLLPAGLAGGLAWLVYYIAMQYNANVIFAHFLAKPGISGFSVLSNWITFLLNCSNVANSFL